MQKLNPAAFMLAGLLGLGLGASADAAPVHFEIVAGTGAPILTVKSGDGSVLVGSQALQPNASGGPGWLLPASIRVFDDKGALDLELTGGQLDFDPDPFIAAAVGFTDFGSPTSLLVTFASPLIMPVGNYTYALEGETEVLDVTGGSVDLGAGSVGGAMGVYFGFVDLLSGDPNVVAAIGASQYGLSSGSVYAPPPVTGTSSCSTCDLFGMAHFLGGSGGGDKYQSTIRFEVVEATAVPEPTTVMLLGLGLATLGFRQRASRR